ncbi:MAG: hypothetical protein IRY99_26330 [Isosphaeraceae bacterium]|nr:hypothetical protein [Isosphaeraceae bacterium]
MIQGADWNGGQYDSYISTNANDPAPQAVSQPGAPDNARTCCYTFVTDGNPREYTITVHVYYDNGAQGDASLTFTTVAPTKADIEVSGQGPPTAYLTNNGQTFGLRLTNNPNNYTSQAGAGVYFTAKTQTGKFGGQFAFVQVVDSRSYLTAVDAQGVTHYFRLINGGTGMNQDSQGNLGYEIDGVGSGKFGWAMGANQPEESHYLLDAPGIEQPRTVTRISVGYPPAAPGQPDPPATPERYVTYLMYKGDTYPTVWVALKKVSWQWTGVATVNAGAAVLSNASGPSPMVTSATGEWPSWTDLIRNHQFQEYTP